MIALEQALNYILDGNIDFIVNNGLDSSYFSRFGDEFQYIKSHIDSYNKTPDLMSFCDKFPNFRVFSVSEPPEFIVQSLKEDKQLRNLADIFEKVRTYINNGLIEEAVNLFKSSQNLLEDTNKLYVTNILEDTSRYDLYIEKCNDFNKFYVKTGFCEIDKLIGGWDRNEELATIVARGGVGKTWFLLKSAVASVQLGLRVGLFSGEMSASKIGYRVDTLIDNISNYALTKGSIDIQNRYKKYIDELNDKYSGKFFVMEPKNGPATVDLLRQFIELYNLDILFIDLHSLLQDVHKSNNPILAASNISKDLKNLLVLKRIPIISASLQNRVDTEENGVSLKNIAQSDRIGLDSTCVIFALSKDNILTLSLVKSRDSVAGKDVKYAIDLDKGIFLYIPEEDNALDGDGITALKEEFDGDDEGNLF